MDVRKLPRTENGRNFLAFYFSGKMTNFGAFQNLMDVRFGTFSVLTDVSFGENEIFTDVRFRDFFWGEEGREKKNRRLSP